MGNLRNGIPGFQLPFEEVGRRAAETLVSTIKGGAGTPNERIEFTLLLRGHWFR